MMARIGTEHTMRLLIRGIMQATGTTQRDVARLTNRTPSAICHAMSGHTHLTYDLTDDILAALGYRLRVDVEPREPR